MRLLRLLFPLLVMAAIIYALYSFVILPLFFHTIKVVHLVDADTLLVKDGNKIMQVQLIGVDAPENGQCFDLPAMYLTAESFFAAGREVRLGKDDSAGDTDPGGRFLRYVYLKNGDFLNEKLIANGWAKQYYDPNKKYQKQDQLYKAQNEARAKNLGIWDPRGCAGNF